MYLEPQQRLEVSSTPVIPEHWKSLKLTGIGYFSGCEVSLAQDIQEIFSKE